MSRICAVNVETRKTLTYGFLLSFFVHFTFLCDSIFCQQALRLEIDTLKNTFIAAGSKRQRSDDTSNDGASSSSGSSSKIAELEKQLEDSKVETKKALEEAKKAQDEKKNAEKMLASSGDAIKFNYDVSLFFSNIVQFNDSFFSQKLKDELFTTKARLTSLEAKAAVDAQNARVSRTEFSPEVKSRLEEEIKILNGKLRRRNMEIDNMRTQVSSVQDLHREINQLKREKAKAESEDHAKQLEEEALKTVELLEDNLIFIDVSVRRLESQAKVGKETLDNRIKMQIMEQDISEFKAVRSFFFHYSMLRL